MRRLIAAVLIVLLIAFPSSAGVRLSGGSISGGASATPETPPPVIPWTLPAELPGGGYTYQANGWTTPGVCDGTLDGSNLISQGTFDTRYVDATVPGANDDTFCGLDGQGPCSTTTYAHSVATVGQDVCTFAPAGSPDTMENLSSVAGGTASDPQYFGTWDKAGTGDYHSQVAHFDGSAATALRALTVNASFVQIGHIKLIDYGRNVAGPVGGGIKITNSNPVEWVDIHNIEFEGVNQQVADDSGRILIDTFTLTSSSNISIRNINGLDYSGYGVRGGCSGAVACAIEMAGLTIQNADFRPFGVDGDFAFGVKLWGPYEGADMRSIRIDGNIANWTPSSNVGVTGLSLGSCMENTIALGITANDARRAILVQPDPQDPPGDFCDSDSSGRPFDGLVTSFDHNLSAAANVLWPIAQGLYVSAQGPTPSLETALNIVVSNSTTCGFNGQESIRTEFAVPGFSAVNNSWDLASSWTWAGTGQATLALWQAASGTDSTGTTAIDCDYPAAASFRPDTVGLESQWASGTGTADSVLLDGSTFDGRQCGGGCGRPGEVMDAATLLANTGVQSWNGQNALTLGMIGTGNNMIAKNDGVFNPAHRYRYCGVATAVLPLEAGVVSGGQWHDLQPAIATYFMYGRITAPGSSATCGFVESPQWYSTQNQAFPEVPNQSSWYVGGNLLGIPLGSVPPGEEPGQSPYICPPGIPAGEFIWRTFQAEALAGTWDLGPTDDAAFRIWNQDFGRDASAIVRWQDFNAMSVGGIYQSGTTGVSIETIYANGAGIIGRLGHNHGLAVGNNGQQGASGTQQVVAVYSDLICGSGDDDRMAIPDVLNNIEPIVPPPGGFPDAP